jgi:hypothetical protein
VLVLGVMCLSSAIASSSRVQGMAPETTIVTEIAAGTETMLAVITAGGGGSSPSLRYDVLPPDGRTAQSDASKSC